MPVYAVPREMGPLSFALGTHLRALLQDLEFDKVGTSYDTEVGRRFAAAGVSIEDGPYDVGDVSFHGALCFHTAGRNGTTQPRRALATTYYEDGARVVDRPTMVSGAWQDFLPGVAPGEVAATDLKPGRRPLLTHALRGWGGGGEARRTPAGSRRPRPRAGRRTPRLRWRAP
jgi:hypothetical protein